MMNKKTSYKRIVSLVLAVFMVASLLSVSAASSENTKIYVNGVLAQDGDEFEADSVTVKIDPVATDDIVEVGGEDFVTEVKVDENGEFVIYTKAPEDVDTADAALVAEGQVKITVVTADEQEFDHVVIVLKAVEETETTDTAETPDDTETKDTADETDSDDATDTEDTADTADESDTDKETTDTADESDTDAETKDTADESDTDKETSDTPDESDTDTETSDTPDESDTDTETTDTPDESDTDTETGDQPKTEKYLNGDVDFDKFITSNDAVLILRRSADLETFDKVQSVVGDVTGNGVYSDDALIVLRASVGLDTINPEYVDVVVG